MEQKDRARIFFVRYKLPILISFGFINNQNIAIGNVVGVKVDNWATFSLKLKVIDLSFIEILMNW